MSGVRVGVTLPQFTNDPTRLLEGARRAEALGLDSIWLFDHMWPLTGGKERPALEAWTTLAYLAAATERIAIGTLVTRSSLRHPAVLAKVAATVARVAPGRLIVGVGSGDSKSRDENLAFGVPYWAGEDRIDQLRSTMDVLQRAFRQDRMTIHDDFVEITELPTSPAVDEPPALWVGGRSDDVIGIAADLADGWNGWGGTPERFAADAATLLELAGDRYVEPTWGGLVTPGAAAAVAEELNGFITAGARHLVIGFSGRWEIATLEWLAGEVRPLLRAQ